MADVERRVVTMPVEARAAEGAPTRLEGYAAVFNAETEIAGLFRERIEPGAFAQAVVRDDVRALFNHDANFVLGRTTAGTLLLSEDATGLRYGVEPPNTTWANDLMVSIQRGDISQSSFAFSVDEEDWQYPAREMPVRIIKRATLYDVSPVTFPAYATTTVSARSKAMAQESTCLPDTQGIAAREMSRERLRWTDAATR